MALSGKYKMQEGKKIEKSKSNLRIQLIINFFENILIIIAWYTNRLLTLSVVLLIDLK